ncbi:MAG: hypothetical protein E7263_09455 [Lachnospiraceae bacterium]|nr:hypothetical protein [Lachnospiraceae bacterium]
MEELLRGQEVAIEPIFQEAFSYSKQVVYFPIRHHSPACSYHLIKCMEEYKPECILIEGPEGANEMLDVMTDGDTEAPFAIYYSYKDSKGYVSKEKEAYKCYYPFLDYSPELVAARYGVKQGANTAFFDLPYAEILIASEENKGLRKKEDKNNYNDDYYLASNRFFKSLVERTGVRHFDEFWEKYFELKGLTISTDEFVKNMLHYCVLSRVNSDERRLQEEGCLSREAYMCKNIEAAKGKYSRILVVTGGFHTYGLMESVPSNVVDCDNQDTKLSNRISSNSSATLKLHNIPQDDQGVYLMSYSMEAADGLNGYASGMPHPSFYQDVWQELEKIVVDGIKDGNDKAIVSVDNGDSNEGESVESGIGQIYKDTVLKYIVNVGKTVRKKEGYLSTYDEICAYNMADNLAMLRGKEYPGAYELYDSVLSSFVKGEYNFATSLPMDILRRQLTGKKIGKLCKNAKIPPLVQSFEELSRKYKLKIGTSVKNEVTLSIFSTKRHREISEFLYQMTFLDTGFAIRQKGPNLRLKKDRNLIREIWSYKWSTQVIAALIDKSVYGGTLEEACVSLVGSKLKEDMNSSVASDILIQMFEMGLSEQLSSAITRLEQLLGQDEDFFSLVNAFSNVIMLDELSALYQSDIEIKPLIMAVYRKVMYTLPHMHQVKEENLADTMEAVKTLNSILSRKEYEKDLESFIDILEGLLNKKDINPGLDGAIRGVLYGRGRFTASEVGNACAGYMSGTKEKKLKAATFLRGVFFTARDLIFVGDTFLRIIDEFLLGVEDKDFMQLLPQFRIAFSYFTPAEIDKLGGKVASMHGMDKSKFKKLQQITPEVFAYGKNLEEQVLGAMEI